ncbi:myrosinase 1-like isoform X2 [Leguminivora glycinivorella]|uniref:myrosinase 1-like isoform X2 n=1 Tax=Leguminivora glycinivorella TaxID=1035111 RepID=UPI00200D4F96|nr:myrosinase 1-like isoform X2 [Leguminivora glycinivorella]
MYSTMGRLVFFICWALTISAANTIIKTLPSKQFPPDFIFGAATAAYQIEGAWDADGRGPSIWDHLVHTDPEHITNKDNGDVAANSYYNYKRDIEMLKELGVSHYRFSISWTRILPFGRAHYINQRGIDHYNKFIDELLANDIVPFATIYHWDLPQILQEHGGWLNEEIVDWFADYARIVFENFGDRIKFWMTINEPWVHCYFSYGYAVYAPKIRSPGVGFYECGRNMLLANARAYHIYNDEFRSTQGGKVGIDLNSEYVYPASDSIEDIEAAKDYLAFQFGQYMHPIFSKSGNYPQRLIHRVAAASTAQGYNSSRLRSFDEDQINYIKGTADFLGLNHYFTKYVYRNSSVIGMFDVPSTDDDTFADSYMDESWPSTHAPWIREHGPGLHHLLVHIKDSYDNPEVYIAENGVSTTTGLNDPTRVSYYRSYLRAVLEALADGCNVHGYFAWSLMDNFEWNFGYSHRFGLYEVDFQDPNRTRTPRKSAFVYREIIRSRTIDYEYDPDPYAGGSSVLTSSLLVLAIVVVAGLFS